MNEGNPITPDLRTLGKVLAPESYQSIILRRDPVTGERTVLMEKVGLTLPEGFFMTEFDELVLNQLHERQTEDQIAALVENEFTSRGIGTANITGGAIGNYLRVLRGHSTFEDTDKPAVVGNFAMLRARYNAMRTLETGVFPDYKRYLQFITASILSQGTALEVGRALHSGKKGRTSAAVVDMMILDLFENSPDKLNDAMEECINEYEDTYNGEVFLADFGRDFKKGFVLRKAPATFARFDKMVNRRVPTLWLEELEKNPSSFRVEYMKYVIKSLEIFVHDPDQMAKPGLRETSMTSLDAWLKDTYMASFGGIGSIIIHTVLGLDIYREEVADIIDRGMDYLALPKTRVIIKP